MQDGFDSYEAIMRTVAKQQAEIDRKAEAAQRLTQRPFENLADMLGDTWYCRVCDVELQTSASNKIVLHEIHRHGGETTCQLVKHGT